MSFGKYRVLEYFSKSLIRFTKLSSIYSFDVSKGVESIKAFEYIKRISLDSPNQPRSTLYSKNMGVCTEQLATVSYHSPGELHQTGAPCYWVSSKEPTIFHTKIPFLIPFDSNSSPKLIHQLSYN